MYVFSNIFKMIRIIAGSNAVDFNFPFECSSLGTCKIFTNHVILCTINTYLFLRYCLNYLGSLSQASSCPLDTKTSRCMLYPNLQSFAKRRIIIIIIPSSLFYLIIIYMKSCIKKVLLFEQSNLNVGPVLWFFLSSKPPSHIFSWFT